MIIAGAGGAAHLPGMTAAMTPLPVLGVPVESQALRGVDSLLSIVQMPAGIPVGTLAIGEAGAINAALLAAAVLALSDPGAGRPAGRLARGADRGGGRGTAERRMTPRPIDPDAAGPVSPGVDLGILGGGQLGRMIGAGRRRLGFRLPRLLPDPDSPAFEVAAARTVADYDDDAGAGALRRGGRRRHLRIRERPGRRG